MLDAAVGADDGVADGGAVLVGELDGDVAEDGGSLVLGVLGESVVQLGGHDVVPHGTGDGEAGGGTNGAEQGEDGHGGGNLLVSDSGHDGDLGAGGEDTGSDTVKELENNEGSDAGARSSVGDQESGTQEHEGNTSEGSVLEISGQANDVSEKRTEEGGSQREAVKNVTSVGNALSVDNQEVRLVVCIPAENGKEHEAVEETSANDVPVPQVLPSDEALGGQVLLPDVEGGDAEDSNNQHGNDVGRLPAVSGV